MKAHFPAKSSHTPMELNNTLKFRIFCLDNGEPLRIDDIHFAIPLNVRLVFAKNDDEGNIVSLARAEEGMEGLKKAIVVEKPVDHSKTHPFTETKCIIEINQRLKTKHPQEFLLERLVAKNKATQEPEINSYCFRAMIDKLKWKHGDNRYHFKDKNHEYHSYSDFAVEELIKHIVTKSDFVKTARESYAYKLRKKKSKS